MIDPTLIALPTRQDVARAARVLLTVNGHDLTEWGGEDLLDDYAQEALRNLAGVEVDVDREALIAAMTELGWMYVPGEKARLEKIRRAVQAYSAVMAEEDS